METDNRRTGDSLVDKLSQKTYDFDFFEAVKTLYKLKDYLYRYKNKKIKVKLASDTTLSFRASEVQELINSKNCSGEYSQEYKLLVNFFGLASGSSSPLPNVYIELLIEENRKRKYAFKDFLEIFENRLLHLFYDIYAKTRVGFSNDLPQNSTYSNFIYSLIGLKTKGLQDRLKIDDKALLYYAGLLLKKPRTMAGLETFLAGYFYKLYLPVAVCWFRWELSGYFRSNRC
jgi:type VI secretion system protein ImpH